MEIAEIAWKLCRKFHFRIRKSSTKFYIKVRKPHFQLQKALFKRSFERNCKAKNVLEYDLEKAGWIIFKDNYFCLKKIILLVGAMNHSPRFVGSLLFYPLSSIVILYILSGIFDFCYSFSTIESFNLVLIK